MMNRSGGEDGNEDDDEGRATASEMVVRTMKKAMRTTFGEYWADCRPVSHGG
jgi:hypothetical protein